MVCVIINLPEKKANDRAIEPNSPVLVGRYPESWKVHCKTCTVTLSIVVRTRLHAVILPSYLVRTSGRYPFVNSGGCRISSRGVLL